MNTNERRLVDTVWQHYYTYGRHELPWRRTTDPYRILVSEVMLQQTQVLRVLPKYRAFIRQFPNTKQLASASLADVLRLWQGLGYNRRAQSLWRSAQHVHQHHSGKWPRTETELKLLPGIGLYTAAAVCAFAYNQPVIMIETNIRTVYLHHCFPEQRCVSDAALLPVIRRTCDQGSPRTWYWALMDYGAYLKSVHKVNNKRSAAYTKQSTFQGSTRQIRGAIIRVLSEAASALPDRQLKKRLAEFDVEQTSVQLQQLRAEKLVVFDNNTWSLPT